MSNRGDNLGHLGIIDSSKEPIYTDGHIIKRSDFDSNPIWTTGEKNYWPGNNA